MYKTFWGFILRKRIANGEFLDSFNHLFQRATRRNLAYRIHDMMKFIVQFVQVRDKSRERNNV